MSEPESSDGQQPKSTPDIATIKDTLLEAENSGEISHDEAEKQKQELEEPKEFSEENEDGTTTGYHMDSQEADKAGVDDGLTEEEKVEKKELEESPEAWTKDDYDDAEAAAEVESEEKAEEEAPKTEPEDDGNSHLFAVRTTGGQEKIVMRLLEARIKMEKINIQSVVLLSDLKGYVVVEAQDVSAMFDAIQGIRHVRGQLRGELTYNEIDKYLIKKSTVSELAVENTVEIIGGPFKGMKATITRLEREKEEATVILLDATYQLPVTVDANYLKLIPA